MATWLEQCGLTFQEVERCIELASMMETSSGVERRLFEARLLGLIEGLGLGWRREISGVGHACEIMNVPWKLVNGKTVWGDAALGPDDPRRDNGKQIVRKNVCETATDLAAIMKELKDHEKVDHDLVMELKQKRKEGENSRRLRFE
jgi:hypothetical protein